MNRTMSARRARISIDSAGVNFVISHMPRATAMNWATGGILSFSAFMADGGIAIFQSKMPN
jgi:hypothetical protein